MSPQGVPGHPTWSLLSTPLSPAPVTGLHRELSQSVYLTNTSRFCFGFALQTLGYKTDCGGAFCLFQHHIHSDFLHVRLREAFYKY